MAVFDLVDQGLKLADRFFGASQTTASFKSHQIAVKLSFTNIKLYIDGTVADSATVSLFPAKTVALVRGAIVADSQTHIVEVYGKSG
ncbi:MAG: hypothetical protein ACM3JG_14870 [Thiohalocapsa sp.]